MRRSETTKSIACKVVSAVLVAALLMSDNAYAPVHASSVSDGDAVVPAEDMTVSSGELYLFNEEFHDEECHDEMCCGEIHDETYISDVKADEKAPGTDISGSDVSDGDVSGNDVSDAGVSDGDVLPEGTYTITYEYNDNGDADTVRADNPDTYTKEDATIRLLNPERTGYTFKGWYKTYDPATGTFGGKTEKIKKGSEGDIILYARWSINTYKVSYGLNGGKNPGGAVKTFTVESEDALLPLPTRKGYTFLGWYTTKKFEEGTEVTGISRGSHGNMKVYAKWYKNVYGITYDMCTDDITAVNSSKNPVTYTVTKSTICLKSPKRTGYTFKGWYANPEYTGRKVTKISRGSTGEITLYAKWSPKTYKITYNLNGGTKAAGTVKSYTIEDETFCPAAPVKKGYEFAGWYTTKKFEEGTEVTEIENGSHGNIKLYARWTAHTYTVVFKKNGADSGEEMEPIVCAYGASKKLPAVTYKKSGYEFKGWSKNKDGSGKIYKNRSSVKNLTDEDGGTVTLYAVWRLPVKVVYNTDPMPSGCNHTWNTWTWQVTCEEPKTTKEFCPYCGYIRKTTYEGKALGHDIQNYLAKEPTCDTYGWVWSKCMRCGKYNGPMANGDNEVDNKPYGHKYEYVRTIFPVKCNSEGREERKCSVCGWVEYFDIPADPDAHNWVTCTGKYWDVENECWIENVTVTSCKWCNTEKEVIFNDNN